MTGAQRASLGSTLDLQSLFAFWDQIDQQFELEQIARLTVDAANRLFQADVARLYLMDFATRTLYVHWNTPERPVDQTTHDLIEGAIAEVLERRSALRRDGGAAGNVGLLATPLLAHNTLVGALVVAKGTHVFAERAEDFLGRIAALAGSAILRGRQFRALREISAATARSLKLERELESVFQDLEKLGFELATISTVDDYRGLVETIRGINVPPEWIKRARHRLDSPDIQAYVCRSRETLLVRGPDVTTARRRRSGEEPPPMLDSDIYQRFDHATLARVFVPIVADDGVVGTIEAGCSLTEAPRVLRPDNVEAVEAIARRCSAAVAEARPFVLLTLIASHAIEILGAQSASMHVYDGDQVLLVAGAGKATGEFLDRFGPRKNGIGRMAIDSGTIQISAGKELERGHPKLFTEGVRAMAAIPLRLGDHVRGVLYVHFWEQHAFIETEIELSKLLARHVEVAIQNSLLLRSVLELSERAWTFSRLQNAIQAVAAGGDLQHVLQNLLQNVIYTLGADNVTLYQYFQDEDRFEFPPVMKGLFYDMSSMVEQVFPDDIVWRTLKQQEPRFSDNVGTDPMLSAPRVDGKEKPRFVERERIRSSATLVLRAAGEPVGVMFVNYRTPHRFAEEDKIAMNAIAYSAAIAIKSVRLRSRVNREATRRLEALEAMKAVLDQVALHKGDVEQQVLDLTLSKALEIIGAQVGIIMWYNEGRQRLESRALRGFPADQKAIVQRLEEGIVGMAARGKQSVLVPDVDDPRWQAVYKKVVPDTRSELAVPLKDEAGLLGVINLEHSAPRRFSDEDRWLLEALAVQATFAIHGVRLYRRLERQVKPLQSLGLISTRLHGELDTDLRLLLTGVTANQGLGFSRAMLFLLDDSRQRLVGRMAIGATSPAEADAVWRETDRLECELVAQQANILAALLDRAERLTAEVRADLSKDSPLSSLLRNIEIPVDKSGGAVARCIQERRGVVVASFQPDPLRTALGEDDLPDQGRAFACVPLLSDGGPIGALVVDNAFLPAESEIDPESVESLDAFAEIASLGIGNARQKGLEQWRTFMQRTGQLIGSRLAVMNALVRKLRASLSEEQFSELAGGITQMQRLLADFRRFTPETAPIFEPLDVRQLLRHVVGTLRASVSFPIELTLSGEPLRIRTDSRILADAITELVENAEEAMNQAHTPNPLIKISATAECAPGAARAALIEIADTGPGVAQEHKQSIFQPLFTTKERGSGLGLMIVWDIIEQHKGTIVEAGRPGAGAHFLIRIPLVREQED